MAAIVDASECFIGGLSDELLLAIMSQLRIERGYLVDEQAENQRRSHNTNIVRTLYALTLSCRKFSAIATPHLYQSVIQTTAQPCMQVQLQTLMSKPDLARFVQYIEYDTFLPSKDTGTEDSSESDVSKYRRQLIAARWLDLPQETRSQMLDRVMDQGCDPSPVSGSKLSPDLKRFLNLNPLDVFTVLLTISDNVQDISLPEHGPYILSLLVCKLYNRPGIFRRLWLKGTGPHMSYPLRMYCGSPKVQHGHLIEYLSRLLTDYPTCLEMSTPAVMEELSLDIYDANTISLNLHLWKCTSLERFSCRWRWTDRFSPQHDVDLPAIHTGLQHVQSTLSHLTIDTMESAWRVDMDRKIPALGSLREFKALRYLNVAGLVLWGDGDILATPPPLSTLLPESLETLIIKTEWDDDVEDALQQLSVDCTSQLPALRKIECTWSPAPAFEAECLQDYYQSAGVELVLDVSQSQNDST